MKPVNPNNKNMLFPAVFRKIGEIMIAVLAAITMLARVAGSSFIAWKSPLFQVAGSTLFIIALIFIGWSRDKDDDEMLSLYRLKAIKLSFFACIIYFVVIAVLNNTGLYTSPKVQGIEPVIGLLFVYYAAFQVQKKGIL